MDDHSRLASQFEAHRDHLRAVAYRMLGSTSEADDAVQDAWLRLSRADVGDIENLGGWLTTVVGRVCLDMLRARQSRREDAMPADLAGASSGHAAGGDPEREAVLTDSVGEALLVVLDTLAPAERLAFVLHDLFGVPFDEIAPIVERSPAATRQLASRARRRVRGAEGAPFADADRRGDVVRAFLAAARDGEFESLVALLDPEALVRRDRVAATMGGEWEARGATAVAKVFSGQARAARPALVDGVPGAVWAPGGKPRVVILFAFAASRIAAIDLVADPERLEEMTIETIEG